MILHLAHRFFGSLRSGGPPASDEAWVAGVLREGEQVLWRRMSKPDRRHAVGVARSVTAARHTDRAVLAAALLHDVGKVESRFGTWRRAVVTGLALLVGRERLSRWSTGAAIYFRHDALGAGLLEAAGSDPLTVAWAREHHLPRGRWTVPPGVGAALKSADDD